MTLNKLSENIHRNGEWLNKQYWKKGLSEAQMAELANCSQSTIHRTLVKCVIPRRQSTKGDYFLDAPWRYREWLYQNYWVEERSLNEMAKMVDTGHTTILTWMKKFSIPRRDKNELAINHIEVSPDIEELVDAVVVGDGHLTNHKSSAGLGYTSIYPEYLDYITSKTESLGIESCNRRPSSTAYQSVAYPEFLTLRRKWYPNGKKQLPRDFQISPLILRLWFIADGHYKYYNRKLHLLISSHIYSRNSLERVVKLLKKIEIATTVFSIGIRIRSKSKEGFFEYILSGEPQVPECYQYKFPEEMVC